VCVVAPHILLPGAVSCLILHKIAPLHGLFFFVAVIFHADFNRGATLRFAVVVGIAQRIGAAAIFLLIKMLAFADFYHARAAAAFAPVVLPILFKSKLNSTNSLGAPEAGKLVIFETVKSG